MNQRVCIDIYMQSMREEAAQRVIKMFIIVFYIISHEYGLMQLLSSNCECNKIKYAGVYVYTS